MPSQEMYVASEKELVGDNGIENTILDLTI